MRVPHEVQRRVLAPELPMRTATYEMRAAAQALKRLIDGDGSERPAGGTVFPGSQVFFRWIAEISNRARYIMLDYS